MIIDPAMKATLQIKYGAEQVLIVPYSATLMIPDKFSDTKINKVERMLNSKQRFILRSDAEYNPSFSQLIPYILVMNDDMSKVYVTKRIAGEERLKDTLALGAGGHVNPVDEPVTSAGIMAYILGAAKRELNEELEITYAKREPYFKYVGTVRDMGSPTMEHLGIVYVVKAKNAEVKEKAILKGKWMSFVDLVNNYNKFESWARYIIDFMLKSGSTAKIVKLCA